MNNYKAVFNLRGDDGATTGGLAVDSNLGWKGAESYVALVSQMFDLRQDPQERHDIFMNNTTDGTWMLVTIGETVNELMKTYVQHPPRKLQSEGYSGPITLTQHERFQHVREMLANEGIKIPLPAGNQPITYDNLPFAPIPTPIVKQRTCKLMRRQMRCFFH